MIRPGKVADLAKKSRLGRIVHLFHGLTPPTGHAVLSEI